MMLSLALTAAQIDLLKAMLYDESQDPRYGSPVMARRVYEEIDNAVAGRKTARPSPK